MFVISRIRADSGFKVQSVPVFRFYWCNIFSSNLLRCPHVPHVDDHCSDIGMTDCRQTVMNWHKSPVFMRCILSMYFVAILNLKQYYFWRRLAREWKTEGSEFESRWGQKFSLLLVVQTGSGAHSASYPIGTGASFPAGKSDGPWSWHSPSISAEIKKSWIYTSAPPKRLHGVALN
jgi:hypothetical protein